MRLVKIGFMSQEDKLTYFSEMSDVRCQMSQILGIDARYNCHRATCNPNFKTLYIRRRSQLLRENSKEEVNPNVRKLYLRIRNQLLSQRYGVSLDQGSIRSRSLGARSSSRITLETNDSIDGRSGAERKSKFSGRSIEESVISGLQESSRSSSGGSSENYSFAGVHHIFDQHKSAVTAVRFANNDKSLLASCSADGTLSICQLTPEPATVLYVLKGHQKGVTSFEWSQSNDLLVSSSWDGSVRLWDSASGICLRTVEDASRTPVLCCTFQPLNNNMVVIGLLNSVVQVVNVSTGIYLKGGSSKTTGSVLCLTFDPAGRILWAGDNKGYITSFVFDLASGKLSKEKRILISEYNCITCISVRNWGGSDGREPSLLINCSANVLLLFSVVDSQGKIFLKRRFPLKHRSHNFVIRSSFCPIMSFRHGTYVVSGSEDMCVYFFDLERESKTCINKLQGHSAPVLDVCFNYDESLLASSDAQGLIIVWKRDTRQS